MLLAGVAQGRRAPGEEAGRLHVRGHVRDLELHGLEVRDGVAELPAVRAYFIEASRLAWAMPTEKAAMPMRPRSRMRSVSTKP